MKTDIIKLLLKLLKTNTEITNKYHIFFNGNNIIARYKNDKREYNDSDLILILELYINTKNRYNDINISRDFIFNSENYNFIVIPDKAYFDNIKECKLFYILPRTVLIDSINNGLVKRNMSTSDTYVLNKEFLDKFSTRKLDIK